MEIIEQGKLPEEQKYQVRCKNCKTLFRFKRSEGKYISDQRDGDSIEVKCPLCNEKCYADAHKDKVMPVRAEAYYNK